MKKFLPFTGLVLVIALTGASCDNGKISPAESELLGCEAYTAALTQLAPLRAADKLSDGTVSVVDHVRETLNPLCLGPAPDVNATVKDIAVDAGVRTLNGILASVF